eukprot:scaffold1955_cov106-Skeletonema_dohrnii-CCMP3373.AAC.16
MAIGGRLTVPSTFLAVAEDHLRLSGALYVALVACPWKMPDEAKLARSVGRGLEEYYPWGIED